MNKAFRQYSFLLYAFVLIGCVGTFSTTPILTDPCQTEWLAVLKQAGIVLPHDRKPTDRNIDVLVFNIHDRVLPGLFFTDGHTEGEIACIGELAAQFDLVLLQEAWVHQRQLAQFVPHVWADHPLFIEGGGGDQWPQRWICETCMSPGLLMLSLTEIPLFAYAEPYRAFAGLNTKLDASDEFFSKGFQLVEFANFWVVNSHLDAGRGQDSVDARRAQLQQLTFALKQLVPERIPLLVGMDANLHADEEQDSTMLAQFLKANHLEVVMHNGPDMILVRGLTTSMPQVLPLKRVLSDHNAQSVIFDEE